MRTPTPDIVTATLAERGQRYGRFDEHARIAQCLKHDMFASPRWQDLAPDQRECLEMIQHKIGRILNGDPNYADSWIDIAGYAALVANRLRESDGAATRPKPVDPDEDTRSASARIEWGATLCDGKSVDYAAAEKACAALGEGWRLPTRMELESILDLTRSDPAIDTTRFPDTKSAWYWTSTSCAWAPGASAWIVSFHLGNATSHGRVNYACVRAVRSVPAGQ